MSELTRKEKEIARIMQDPVLWAEYHLGEKPRWYQEQALRHPHNRKVLRWGRRLGKCIAEGQRLVDAKTGAYVPVEDLYEKGSARTFSLDNQYKIVEEDMFRVEKNGIKEVFKITLSNGACVELTGNHPLLTINGWTEVRDLTVGESVATPVKIPIFGTNDVSYTHARMIAYSLFCGKKTNLGSTFEITPKDGKEEMLEVITKEAGLKLFPKSQSVHFTLPKDNPYIDLINQEYIEIPDEVYTYTENKLAAFLAAVIDAKGYISKVTPGDIGYMGNDEKLVLDLKHLFLRFGIKTNILTKIRNKGSKKQYTEYKISIVRKEDLDKYFRFIAPYSFRDYSKTIELCKNSKAYELGVPKEIHPYIEEKRIEKNLNKIDIVKNTSTQRLRPKEVIKLEDFKEIAKALEDGFLYDLAHSDIAWYQIKSIESIGEKMTYDVMMPKYHNLLIEDIFVHNTWTMVAHMLFACHTNMGGTKKSGNTICLVATPYDSQALNIYKQIIQFIDKSDIIRSSIVSTTKSPYNITFANGSEIRLFTTGAKTSSGGASIRGQRADYIYLDEMD